MKKILLLVIIYSQYSFADVMNLNEFMPTRLEDASPMKEKTTSFQYSSFFEEHGPEDRHVHRPNLRYGVTEQLQLDAMATLFSGVDEEQSGEIDIGGLYQISRSNNWVPIFAINPLFTFPTGKGSKGEDFQYKIIMSSTIKGTPDAPVTQVHLNVNHSYNDERKFQERLHQLAYAIGFAHRLSPNTALIADIIREEETTKNETTDVLEIGIHQSLGGGFQTGIGIGAGLSKESPSWTGVLGLEKQF
ncbi:MAG TPA: hypothetical protein VNJ08_07240 [Bacteriovoracaceae bacterium]|nr:hypothetical protein [Bacteriovoracaceae bacterium]